MPYQFPPDVRDKITARLARGEYQSEDDVLRSALEALEESETDLTAIRFAIEQWQAGDEGVPLADAFEAIRNGNVSGSQA